MLLNMYKGKIHKATVTEANLNYVGSITIDRDLMDGAGMHEGERVQIVNNCNGERIETYIIEGERGSGVICLNGAAARRVQVGDEIIIISYCWIDEKEVEGLVPKIVFVDEDNKIIETAGRETHGENK